MSRQSMPVRCTLKVLMARENLTRAQRGEPHLTFRTLAAATNVPLSSLSLLATGKTQRIDFKTIDRLCGYFQVGVGDLLVRDPEPAGDDRSNGE
jgi:DNA-binding Xre family transcriptional regulator